MTTRETRSTRTTEKTLAWLFNQHNSFHIQSNAFLSAVTHTHSQTKKNPKAVKAAFLLFSPYRTPMLSMTLFNRSNFFMSPIYIAIVRYEVYTLRSWERGADNARKTDATAWISHTHAYTQNIHLFIQSLALGRILYETRGYREAEKGASCAGMCPLFIVHIW